LTTAELRVLHFLPTNLTLTEIAQRLYVSRNTAKTHAAAVYRKLGVSSRGEAVDLARSVGLLAGGAAEPSNH
jgi:LuxR family maltose regulon positive regulatory protein